MNRSWCIPAGVANGNSILVAQIYFDTGSCKVTDHSKKLLRRLGSLTSNSEDNTARLFIVGHADYRGVDKFNIGLGRKRAEAISSFVQSSLEGNWWTTTVSKGEAEARQPQIRSVVELEQNPQTTSEEMQADRRVDIFSPDALGRNIKMPDSSLVGDARFELIIESYTLSAPSARPGLRDGQGQPVNPGPRVKGRGAAMASQAHKNLVNNASKSTLDNEIEKFKPMLRDELIQRRIDGLEADWGALVVVASTTQRNGQTQYGPPVQAIKLQSNASVQKFFPNKDVAFNAYWESRTGQSFLEDLDQASEKNYLCFWIRQNR